MLLDEDDGQEDGHCREGAGKDRPPDFARTTAGGLEPARATLVVAEDVLEYNDRIVDHHPHGKCHPGQADHIHRPAE